MCSIQAILGYFRSISIILYNTVCVWYISKFNFFWTKDVGIYTVHSWCCNIVQSDQHRSESLEPIAEDRDADNDRSLDRRSLFAENR